MKTWKLPAMQVIKTQKRVLRLLHQYMKANLNDTTLVTAGGGLMTWGELRLHVKEALKLRVQEKSKAR